MVSTFGRQSLRAARAVWKRRWLGLVLLALTVGGACRSRAPQPTKVIYINRRAAITPQEQQALATARAEVDKWDVGLQVADYRVQRHRKGWTVSLLLTSGLDEQGKPQFPEQPIRNVEINRAMEVVGYHVSQ